MKVVFPAPIGPLSICHSPPHGHYQEDIVFLYPCSTWDWLEIVNILKPLYSIPPITPRLVAKCFNHCKVKLLNVCIKKPSERTAAPSQAGDEHKELILPPGPSVARLKLTMGSTRRAAEIDSHKATMLTRIMRLKSATTVSIYSN